MNVYEAVNVKNRLGANLIVLSDKNNSVNQKIGHM